jgi:hypothetical protein
MQDALKDCLTRLEHVEAENTLMKQQLSARNNAAPVYHNVSASRETSQAAVLPEVTDASSYPLSASSSAGHLIAQQLSSKLKESLTSKSPEVKSELNALHARLLTARDERNRVVSAIMAEAERRGDFDEQTQVSIDKEDETLQLFVLTFYTMCSAAFGSSNPQEPNNFITGEANRVLNDHKAAQKGALAQDVTSFLAQLTTRASERANIVRGANAASAAQREAAGTKPSPKKGPRNNAGGGGAGNAGGKKPGNAGGTEL